MWITHETPRLQIGDWWFHPAAGELRADAARHRLEPRVSDVLLKLCEHAGDVVSRAHFFDLVWRDRVVVDEVLTRAICQIRAAFGDACSPHRYVETLPKRGYRLIAPVRVEPIDARQALSFPNQWAVSIDRRIQPDGAPPPPLLCADRRVPRPCRAPGSRRDA